jgi:hypothetical protein
MTFKTMIDRVKYTLGAEEVIGNDEVALIKQYLNLGVINILVRTRPYTRQIKLNLTGGVKIHDMSNEILALVDVQGPNGRFLDRLSRQDITSAQAGGSPGFAYEEPLLWISPVPDEDSEITAFGIFRPTAMASDTDDPAQPSFGGLAPEFHEAIVMYGLWKGGEYIQHEGSAQGERWRVQYEGQDGTEGEIARIKRIINKRVTPNSLQRRDLSGNLGVFSDSGSYSGARA